ncbi:MAG: 4-(cytidine 5'-diphospho)-2-C-methyl-D-erythritol kinase [Bacteroides sp.]|nr:4-(cytidine 5'-diphospho)-2-C-methyl-D-erythritol kinase [Bacteroides sp.]
MLRFPNAKINIGLYITGKRPDGYHNLETIFYPVMLEDALEILPVPSSSGECQLHLSGNYPTGEPGKNLVVKAYQLLNTLYNLPSAAIYLFKNIPTGAGLGGGSSDAAFTLKMLSELFALNLSDKELETHAARLGADCSFFIRNKPLFTEGIGEIFSPITLTLNGYGIILVKPDIFISTPETFRRITPSLPTCSLKESITLPVEEWKNHIGNDFETSIFPNHPFIREIKEELYHKGALYASMSGSGSSVYGIFEKDLPLPEITFPSSVFTWKGVLK